MINVSDETQSTLQTRHKSEFMFFLQSCLVSSIKFHNFLTLWRKPMNDFIKPFAFIVLFKAKI